MYLVHRYRVFLLNKQDEGLFRKSRLSRGAAATSLYMHGFNQFLHSIYPVEFSKYIRELLSVSGIPDPKKLRQRATFPLRSYFYAFANDSPVTS